MKHVLILTAAYPTNEYPGKMTYIQEQLESLRAYNKEFHFYLCDFKGYKSKLNYLRACETVKRMYYEKNISFIHAHYSLSALIPYLLNLPYVVTFHGSDVNISSNRCVSYVISRRSEFNIFVSKKLHARIPNCQNARVVPCGVNLKTFYPVNQQTAKHKLNMDINKKYILFPGDLSNKLKGPKLFNDVISRIGSQHIGYVELKNKSRAEVNLLLNACSLVLMTSENEGSPQIIKEAMACNTPIVSVDVGDVKDIIENTSGCYICERNVNDLVQNIKQVLQDEPRTRGRNVIKDVSLSNIAKKLISVYEKITVEHHSTGYQ